MNDDEDRYEAYKYAPPSELRDKRRLIRLSPALFRYGNYNALDYLYQADYVFNQRNIQSIDGQLYSVMHAEHPESATLVIDKNGIRWVDNDKLMQSQRKIKPKFPTPFASKYKPKMNDDDE